jgi:hypothetical protein
MAEIEKYIYLKITKIFITTIFWISFAALFILDLNRLLDIKPFEEISFIRLRLAFYSHDIDTAFYVINNILALCTCIAGYIIWKKMNNYLKKRENKTKLLDMLRVTINLFCYGRFLETIYLIFDTDFNFVQETALQFYIVLDVLGCVILVAIASILFLEGNLIKSSKKAISLLLFLVVCVFLSYLMTVIFAVYPDAFPFGSIISGVFIGFNVIIALIIWTRIFKLKKIPSKNANVLTLLGFQLIFSIICIAIMLPLGLTTSLVYAVPPNIYPNRILRVVRLTILLISIISYYPAYIKPSLRQTKNQ